MKRLRRVVAVVLLLAALAGACGKDEPEVVAPLPVPDGLVPEKVQDDKLAFYETSLPGASKAFADAGEDSLASDGRLWELRTGDRLIGVLQVTTLLPEVDLLESGHRDAIVKQILPTARDRIDIGDVAVWSSTTSGKSTYVWFGDGLFALLTLKPGSEDAIEPEGVLQDVLDHMVAAEGWEYVYFDEEEGEDL